MGYDKFIITGCGRSGTGFYSNLMKENGINCGHESYISLRGPKSFNFVAESSWLAVPFLASIPDNYYIIRTLRDPFKVIKSFYELSVFISLGSPYYKFIKSNLFNSIVDINFGLEKKSSDMLELSNISNYYLGWNKLFDTKIVPILMYGCEIWGFQERENIEIVQRYACKRYICLNAKTINAAVLGDCGRYPLYIESLKR